MTPVSEGVLASVLPKSFPRSLNSAAARLFGLGVADRVYETLRSSGDTQPLFSRLLEFMRVSYQVTSADLRHIPRAGAAVIVANHPFGILEAAVLATVVRQIRGDVRVLANDLLSHLPELGELIIPVDVTGGSPNANVSGIRRAVRFLSRGGLLIVFPAGAVSHFQWSERASADPPWTDAVPKLIALAARGGKAPVTVPVFIPGANSVVFHAAGMVLPRLRTALLARELFNKERAAVELRIGRPVPYAKLAEMTNDRERIEYLRWRTYLMARRNAFKPRTRAFGSRQDERLEHIIDPVPAACLSHDVAHLPESCLLARAGDLCVYLTEASTIPSVLREIGRLREITFRQAGEGTGRALDLDSFDQHYLHLFVWHSSRQEVVGAYRLKRAEEVSGLYTATLFQFDHRFLQTIGPAVELGRSFVRAEYQKTFAPLVLLWLGIGKFIAANPRYKTLFGPVSISNKYHSVARELMIAFLEKRAGIAEWMGLVRPRNAPAGASPETRCSDVDELADVISDLDPTQPGIPVLLRQYLKLGGKLLGFNVDPEFSSVLDGLILVDLTQTEPKLLERYLGKAEAASFLDFHKEHNHGT